MQTGFPFSHVPVRGYNKINTRLDGPMLCSNLFIAPHAVCGTGMTEPGFMTHFINSNTSTDVRHLTIPGTTVDRYGTPYIATAQYTHLWSSCYFDGSGDWWNFSTGGKSYAVNRDFSAETWVRFAALPPTSPSPNAGFFGAYNSSTNHWSIGLYNNSGTYYWRFYTNNSGTIVDYQEQATVAINTWYAVRFVQIGDDMKFYVNGTLVGTGGTSANSRPNTTGSLCVGTGTFTGSGRDQYLNGHLSEIRIKYGSECEQFGDYTVRTWMEDSYQTAVKVTADYITVADYNSGKVIGFKDVSLTCNLTRSGIGGLDTGTGSFSYDTFYYLWLVSNGYNPQLIFSTSQDRDSVATPPDYTYKRLISVVLTSSAGILRFYQTGSRYHYADKVSICSAAAHYTTYYNESLASYIPPYIIRKGYFSVYDANASGDTGGNQSTNYGVYEPSYGNVFGNLFYTIHRYYPTGSTYTREAVPFEILISPGATPYISYYSNGSYAYVSIWLHGFEFPI